MENIYKFAASLSAVVRLRLAPFPPAKILNFYKVQQTTYANSQRVEFPFLKSWALTKKNHHSKKSSVKKVSVSYIRAVASADNAEQQSFCTVKRHVSYRKRVWIGKDLPLVDMWCRAIMLPCEDSVGSQRPAAIQPLQNMTVAKQDDIRRRIGGISKK